ARHGGRRDHIRGVLAGPNAQPPPARAISPAALWLREKHAANLGSPRGARRRRPGPETTGNSPWNRRAVAMDDTRENSDPATSESGPGRDTLIREFIEHWGMMARAWGINPTMGELFALLYITGTDWTAEELRHRLKVSRGNVSMNLRELL